MDNDELLEQLVGEAIHRIWYQGNINYYDGYHEVLQAVFIQFHNGDTYKFQPHKAGRNDLGHQLAVGECKYWEKEKKLIPNLVEVTEHKDYRIFMGNEVKACRSEINHIADHRLVPCGRMMNSLSKVCYVQSVAFAINTEDVLNIAACKIMKDGKMLKFYNQISIFFKKGTFEGYSHNYHQPVVW